MNFLGDDELDGNIKTLGGKAANLHVLKKAGFPVPSGFVLTSAISVRPEDISTIGGFPVAVRSSCSMEDLANASFAGLYETFLDVSDHSELQDTVQRCFQSVQSERVLDYLRTKNIEVSPAALSMSVLVQKMVASKVSGVLFTLNPVNGREEEFYLEYCEGLGERLVSGHVTPTTCRYDHVRHEIIEQTINQEGTSLSREHMGELARVSLLIQAHFGAPQDIEWAIDAAGKLFILQSRPVTAFTPRDDVPELTNADFKDGGVSARVCTPVMYSLYRNALQISMGDYFKAIKLVPNDEEVCWIYYQYGRVYWNAGAVKEGLKRIPGFNEEKFDRDLGIQKDYGSEGPHETRTTVAGAIGAIPVLLGLYNEFRDCENMVSLFSEQFELKDEKLKEKCRELRRMSDEEFAAWFLEVILFQWVTEKNYFRTIYNNSNFQTEFKTFLSKSSAYRENDELDLMVGLEEVAHLDVQTDLDRLTKIHDFYGIDSATYYEARETFLKRHYHHGPAELDLTVPRWGEKKEWVDDLVRSNPGRRASDTTPFNATAVRLEEGMGMLGRSKFRKMLKRSRKFLKIREEMRSLSTRAYYLVRQGLLEFGRRRSLPESLLFMLEIDEVRCALRGEALPDDLKERRLRYEGLRNFTPPNEFGGTIQWASAEAAGGVLKGIGCSPGEFIGHAKIVLDIHATHELSKEDVLITAFTDPGWTPVLARVGAVVTEVGGLLSHAAVIGREYGIPAVLNLQGATVKIPEGARIRVNGKTGTVEILEEGAD